jgi:hypothetical protein
MVTNVPMVPLVGVREAITGAGKGVKVAVTVLFAVMFTVQRLPFTKVQPCQDLKT